MSFSVSEYAWPAHHGRKPFKHQVHTTSFVLRNPRCFVLNDMGCVDAETEYLSETGWHKISTYDGRKVAQWDSNTHQIEFVEPTRFIKRPCDEFIVWPNQMVLSAEHRVVGYYQGEFGVKSALDVHNGDQVALIRTFRAPIRVGLPYTDDVLRVIVAYIADGSLHNGMVRVRLKLPDKVLRMRELLNKSGISYKEQSYNSDGKTNFIFVPPIMTQEFGPEFYRCTESQLRVICDEVWRWDGRIFNDRHNCWEFNTMRRCSADFVQYAFSAIGHIASITPSSKVYKYTASNPRTRQSGEKTTMYTVRASQYLHTREFSHGSSIKSTGDGFKYCFEVPKTFWLMRRFDKIFVTGNTGKTLSALWALDMLFAAKKIRRAVVVCPLSIMRAVWVKEVQLNVPHLKVGVAHGTRQQRADVIRNPALHIVIINHDGIKSAEDELLRDAPDVYVIDELTAYKSNSDRTKCMMRLAKSARGVWGMTGDLTPNSPLEAYYPIKIVNPSSKWFQLTPYYSQFRDACMVQVNEVYWIPKPEAPQIVTMCAQPSIRYTRDQCLDLPETTYQEIEVPMSAEQTKFYDEMKKRAYLATESGEVTAVNAAIVLNKLLQISAGAVKNDAGDVIEVDCKDRIDALMELYEETPQRKLVVFATFRATIFMLERELTKRGVKCATIFGDVPHAIRSSRIEQFQTGDLSVLILQPQASAHGITLTASSTVVWFSLVASNELFQQGNARIVRIGQDRKTFVYMLIGSKADAHMADILKRKGDVSRETLELFTTRDL